MLYRLKNSDVPFYGEGLDLDSDELSFLKLDPKLSTYPKILEDRVAMESALCNTKARYHRLEEGSPQEQEDWNMVNQMNRNLKKC